MTATPTSSTPGRRSASIDPTLLASNRVALADHTARHFGWQVQAGVATLTLTRHERKNPRNSA